MTGESRSHIARELIRVRVSQLKINEMYKEKKFKVPIHLALGHESIAVAVGRCMSAEDKLVLSHRNAHYNLARSDTLQAEIDEYLLKPAEGMAHAELGSMNLANEKVGIPYSSSILGNNLCVATGIALAEKVKHDPGVTIVVTGDGAMEEGAFYESLLNMKSLGLRALVIVENNRWSLGTEIQERRCPIDVRKLVSGLDIEYVNLSGNDTFDYVEKLQELRDRAVAENAVFVVEVNLTSLGFWYMKHEEFPNGKFINYHAGPAPEVKLNEHLVLEETDRDPIHVLKKTLGPAEFESLSKGVVERVLGELS
jgi:pyruvate dehydrogenase E1 component alpha subunit